MNFRADSASVSALPARLRSTEVRRLRRTPFPRSTVSNSGAQIVNLLKELQTSRNLTYLFISHDLSVVQHISDRVGVMYLGNFVEMGDKKDIFSNPMHPYTQALFSAVPVPDPHYQVKRIILQGDIPSPANPPKGCKFHTRCAHCMDICKEVAPKFIDYGNGHLCACHLYPQEPPHEA